MNAFSQMNAFTSSAFAPNGGTSSGAFGGGGGEPAPPTPVNVTPPSIDIGDGLVGTVATSTPAVWDGVYTITQQWFINGGGPISGATATTFAQTEATAGTDLKMREYADGIAYSDSNVETTEILSAPTLSGATIFEDRGYVGDIMDSGFSYGSFGNPPAANPVVYEWKEGTDPYVVGTDTKEISEISTDYLLRVSLTNSQGTGSTESTAYISAGNVAPDSLTPPTAAAQGSLIVAVTSDGTWSGNPAPTFASYQWQYDDVTNGWTDVSGATSSSYSGAPLVSYRCGVTYSNAGGSANQYSNAAVAVL